MWTVEQSIRMHASLQKKNLLPTDRHSFVNFCAVRKIDFLVLSWLLWTVELSYWTLLPGLPVTLFGDIRIRRLIQCSTKPNQINFMVSRPLGLETESYVLSFLIQASQKVAGVRGGGLGVGWVRGIEGWVGVGESGEVGEPAWVQRGSPGWYAPLYPEPLNLFRAR